MKVVRTFAPLVSFVLTFWSAGRSLISLLLLWLKRLTGSAVDLRLLLELLTIGAILFDVDDDRIGFNVVVEADWRRVSLSESRR